MQNYVPLLVIQLIVFRRKVLIRGADGDRRVARVERYLAGGELTCDGIEWKGRDLPEGFVQFLGGRCYSNH